MSNVDLEEAIRKAASVSVSVDERIKQILVQHFELPQEGATDVPNPGYVAYGYMAVDVGIRLANMFLAIKNPGDPRTFRAICDLTYQLESNQFWSKNAGFLTPMIHVALNAHSDAVALLADRSIRNEYSTNDALIAAGRAAPLELFPMLAYLVGGPKLMATRSLQLKLDLAPYFLG